MPTDDNQRSSNAIWASVRSQIKADEEWSEANREDGRLRQYEQCSRRELLVMWITRKEPDGSPADLEAVFEACYLRFGHAPPFEPPTDEMLAELGLTAGEAGQLQPPAPLPANTTEATGPTPETDEHPDDMLDINAVKRRTGLSRSTIYRRVDAGVFPEPYKNSPGRIAWRRGDVDAYNAKNKRQPRR